MLMLKICKHTFLQVFVANLKIDSFFAFYPESFCYKNLETFRFFLGGGDALLLLLILDSKSGWRGSCFVFLFFLLLYELFSWSPNELCFGHFHQRAAGKGHPPLRKPQNRPPSNIFCCFLIQNLFRLQNEFSKIFLW